jgi:hypothetical protein
LQRSLDTVCALTPRLECFESIAKGVKVLEKSIGELNRVLSVPSVNAGGYIVSSLVANKTQSFGPLEQSRFDYSTITHSLKRAGESTLMDVVVASDCFERTAAHQGGCRVSHRAEAVSGFLEAFTNARWN